MLRQEPDRAGMGNRCRGPKRSRGCGGHRSPAEAERESSLRSRRKPVTRTAAPVVRGWRTRFTVLARVRRYQGAAMGPGNDPQGKGTGDGGSSPGWVTQHEPVRRNGMWDPNETLDRLERPREVGPAHAGTIDRGLSLFPPRSLSLPPSLWFPQMTGMEFPFSNSAIINNTTLVVHRDTGEIPRSLLWHPTGAPWSPGPTPALWDPATDSRR